MEGTESRFLSLWQQFRLQETVKSNTPIRHCDAEELLKFLPNKSVALLATDPPYFKISKEQWDHQWSSTIVYAQWLVDIFRQYYEKLTDDGSLIFFGGIGHHGHRPLFEVMNFLESRSRLYTYRDMITWKKRRAYGKSHAYLFCREEILWYSKSPIQENVRFNIPLTNVRRGYKGFNKKYPAKSEYKRVSNVWDDIPEIMKPSRPCEKPVALMKRIVETHSRPGDLVVDFFTGTGPTGVACVETNRLFLGCDTDKKAVKDANLRIRKTSSPLQVIG